jgi:hypothetical protein
MAWIAVVKQDDEGRIVKFLDFATEAEALAHVAKISADYPDAFASAAPAGGVRDFKGVNGGLVSDPVIDALPTPKEKRSKAYKAELGDDVLDDLIREVRALAAAPVTPQFGELVAKVDEIDARFPD